ncbi:Bug family tripartite tricarboxylate transporter substrate binding protein [Diaphorobacter aerolatus]|uniref:Tripartite tricarboxylate transporter substrate binding protein n=1 Tax=Diaphorobacter aerolatus TaxID=1288495 RepID=A0A7H0GP22_9BURK|nr:tripartite tricarboxylate transporter substrate binding protein [Diaphorobacter aerolatus]QNP50038.1 tripartite tricarboxylate transporter substrate binding protein [Diaphorobacter aerolatus]
MNKTPMKRRSLLAMAAATAAVLMAPTAHAQANYPDKPIRLIIPFAAGGSVDMVGRIISEILTKQLNATVIVENVPGAAGVVGAQKVVSSKPDGYTLMAGSSNEMAGTKFVNAAQKYDPAVDLTPIGLAAIAPNIWVAGANMKVKNVEEFVALAKANPGKYSYGSPGIGSTPHFSGELIKKIAGVEVAHIPYKGSAAMVSDLAGGTLDFGVISQSLAAPFIKDGRMTALGVTTAHRIASMKDVPALGESPSLKGYALNGWFAFAGPKGLPPEIVSKLQGALKAGLADPAIRERLDAAGAPAAKGDEDLARIIRTDMAKYADLVKFAKITPE